MIITNAMLGVQVLIFQKMRSWIWGVGHYLLYYMYLFFQAVSSLPPEQMFELMKQMKICIQNNPNEARNMLLQNPQLAYALLQAQIVMKIVDPQVAMVCLAKITCTKIGIYVTKLMYSRFNSFLLFQKDMFLFLCTCMHINCQSNLLCITRLLQLVLIWEWLAVLLK